jgi:hypothetical protein
MLAAYITDTQDLLNDLQGQFYTTPTLIRYINRARRRIAGASGCLRVLPVGTTTMPGVETYAFSDWNSLVQEQMPGVQSVLHCRTLSMAIGTGGWKPMWRRLVWTDFQARFRIYNGTFYGVLSEPGWWAQYGAGQLGKIYLAPIPSQMMPLDVDLSCIPSPLLTDNDPEPIPYPWDDAVPYWAATMALLQQQRREDAAAMAQLFNAELPMCASIVCPQMIQTGYGAAIRSA